MNVASTSAAAYASHVATGAAGRQANRVLDAVRSLGEPTRNEVSLSTGIHPGAVCGRVRELIAAGLLVERGGKRPDRYTGIHSKTVAVAR